MSPNPIFDLCFVSKDAATLVGPASHLAWSSDGYALAVAWHHCGWALWSVSGGLLYTSLGERVDLAGQLRLTSLVSLCSMYLIAVSSAKQMRFQTKMLVYLFWRKMIALLSDSLDTINPPQVTPRSSRNTAYVIGCIICLRYYTHDHSARRRAKKKSVSRGITYFPRFVFRIQLS
ncbi:unnamed protein product [Echinostoma caproni]|uniref:ANAPC4_WD40 domain-containing protein n=1 Tax=Echinostoma caproni TaxID=27848 RepID=A0A183BC75_9TREM|nr:unnamed protein product [Echinostoma caproni]